jgi:hypothetical protein
VQPAPDAGRPSRSFARASFLSVSYL